MDYTKLEQLDKEINELLKTETIFTSTELRNKMWEKSREWMKIHEASVEGLRNVIGYMLRYKRDKIELVDPVDKRDTKGRIVFMSEWLFTTYSEQYKQTCYADGTFSINLTDIENNVFSNLEDEYKLKIKKITVSKKLSNTLDSTNIYSSNFEIVL